MALGLFWHLPERESLNKLSSWHTLFLLSKFCIWAELRWCWRLPEHPNRHITATDLLVQAFLLSHRSSTPTLETTEQKILPKPKPRLPVQLSASYKVVQAQPPHFVLLLLRASHNLYLLTGAPQAVCPGVSGQIKHIFFQLYQYFYTDKICFLFRVPVYMMSLPQRVTREQVQLWLPQTAFICLEKVSFLFSELLALLLLTSNTKSQDVFQCVYK